MEEWTDYLDRPAPRVLCIFRRRETGQTFVANPAEFHPEFNIAGLEWKITGIGREQLEAMPLHVRWEAQRSPWVLMPGLMGQQSPHALSYLFG